MVWGELGLVTSDIVELLLQFIVFLKFIIQLSKPTGQTTFCFILMDRIEYGLLCIGTVVAHLLYMHIVKMIACARISIDIYFHDN